MSHISFYHLPFFCQWVLYSLYVPRPKISIASFVRSDRQSKDVTHPLRADEKFLVPNISHHFEPTHPRHSWFWSWSDWIDAKSTLRQICCLKLRLDFLWRLIDFIQVVGSPSCIFHAFVPDEIGKNPLEYMEVQILDYLSTRMRQQLEDVDHLRCSSTKTLGSKISFCSRLDLYCCM